MAVYRATTTHKDMEMDAVHNASDALKWLWISIPTAGIGAWQWLMDHQSELGLIAVLLGITASVVNIWRGLRK